MGKKELYIFIGTIGIEGIAVGVGVMVSPTWGWSVAVGGLVIAWFFFWRALKVKTLRIQAPANVINRRIRERRQYLPQLKQLIIDYINRVEYLAMNTEAVYDLPFYKEVYPANRWIRRISKYDDKQAILQLILKHKGYQNNIIFRKVQDEDEELFNINQQIDTYNTNVIDKQVRNYVVGFREGAHMAYSYVIFSKLVRTYFEKVPFVFNFYIKRERKMQDNFRQHQKDINTRIQELMDGAEDEL